MVIPIKQIGVGMFALGLLGYLTNPITQANELTYLSIAATIIGFIIIAGR